jgi:hypothetical protein
MWTLRCALVATKILPRHTNLPAYEEAKVELQACTQLDPSRVEANLGLGLILMGEGKTAEARVQCRKALASANPGVRDAAQKALEQLGR